MKDIEKLLREELSNIVPSMSEELRNHPITSREKKPVFIPWKLVISVCSLVIIAVLAISLSILNPSAPGSQIGTSTPTQTTTVENEHSYYLIQINPKILIKTNNCEVLDVKPLNNDAEKLLENIIETIKNSEIIDGVNLIAEKAVEQG